MSLQHILTWQQPAMVCNIKQAGWLKASPMQICLGLALFSLSNNQQNTNVTVKKLTRNLLIVLRTFLRI